MQALPNAAEAALAEVIRRQGRPGFESALLAFLGRAVAPDNLIVLAYRDAAPPLVLFRQAQQPSVFAELERVYLAGAYVLDPYHDLHVRRAGAGLYRIADIAPDAFQRSRYMIEYYQATGIIDELTYVAYPAPGVTLNLCLGRDAGTGRVFSAREIEVAGRIAPLVVALAEAHWAGLPASEPLPEAAPAARLVGALDRARGIRLSPRQAEVALLILRGHSTPSIALVLGVSAQTVKVFRRQVHARCGVTSQAELFALMLPLLGTGAPP
ncbi:MAG: helix-turn-helix transcriptional regulator [Gemmobacter sp.]